jgi:hypothetical protein
MQIDKATASRRNTLTFKPTYLQRQYVGTNQDGDRIIHISCKAVCDLAINVPKSLALHSTVGVIFNLHYKKNPFVFYVIEVEEAVVLMGVVETPFQTPESGTTTQYCVVFRGVYMTILKKLKILTIY